MNRLLSACVLALGWLMGVAYQPALAQYPPYSPYLGPGNGLYSRPTVSPYLNLLRGGNPAANYFSGVIPERERRYQANQFNTQIQDLERRPATAPAAPADELIPTLPETGHAVTFLNMTPYYNYGAPYNPALGSRPNQRPLQQGQGQRR